MIRLLFRPPMLLALAFACVSANAAAPERVLHRYLAFSLSPDGKRVASVEGDATKSGGIPSIRALVIRGVAGGEVSVALPCGKVPQCWPDSPVWTHDSAHLTFSLRTPGSHARSVYTVKADGTALTKLLDFNGTIVDLQYGPKDQLAMLATADATKEVGATEAGASPTANVDEAIREQRIGILDNGKLKWASPADLFIYEYDWLPDGSGFVGTAAPGDGDNNWWVAKLYAFPGNSAAKVIYTPVNAQQQLAQPRVSRDGKRVAFIGGLMSDFGSTGGDVFSLALSGGTATDLTDGMKASATSLAWSCDGKLLVRFLAGADFKLLDFGDGSSGKSQELWSGAEPIRGEEAGLALGCPSDLTATMRDSHTMPPEIYVGALGAWRQLTHANDGMTVPARAQSISWKSDEFDVQGWLLVPTSAQGTSKLPMVTIVHGGPSSAATPGFIGPGLTRSLLERGYAVFFPNPRGSFGQGEKFTRANVRDFGYGDLRDILAGVDAAIRAAPIDGARLAISGGSYGGYMTMWAVTQTQRFKAAIAGAGIANWLSYYGQNGIDAWMIPFFGHSVYDDPEVFARSAPITFIRKVKTPTFVYVGERDIECPAPQTQEFWHALKTLGVPTDIAIYPGEGHGLRDEKNIADLERRSLAWLDKFLNTAPH